MSNYITKQLNARTAAPISPASCAVHRQFDEAEQARHVREQISVAYWHAAAMPSSAFIGLLLLF